MADLYANYAELAAAETEGVTYARRTVPVSGSTWCSVAIHGGGIEAGSGEAARAVGDGLMSHYEFAGLKSSNNTSLHITSTNFDEPIAEGVVHGSRRCLSFHGFAGDEGVAVTAVGGLDATTVARVRANLEAAGFAVTTAPSEIAGTNPANICNETLISAGVQLEMSRAQRAAFFPNGDLSRSMRDSGQRTDAFHTYVSAVRAAFQGQGTIALGSINSSRYCLLPATSPDVDLTATVSTDVLATGGGHFLSLVARYLDGSNLYMARLEFATDQRVILTIRKRIAAAESFIVQHTTDLTHSASRQFRVRFQTAGSTLRAKTWVASGPEPMSWQLETTDIALTAAGQIGMRSILSTANTNTLPVIAAWDDFDNNTNREQVFTVERAANGVVKPHSAGTAVSLARPTFIAL